MMMMIVCLCDEAADAALLVKQKIFSRQSNLQNFFKPSAAHVLTVGGKGSHAIDSEVSKIMKPKERLVTWTNHISDKDRIRRKTAEQRRRDAARSLLDARLVNTLLINAAAGPDMSTDID